jgi:acylphosphatase
MNSSFLSLCTLVGTYTVTTVELFDSMQKTISIKVNGMVQGVYYRQSARQYAMEQHICGTVKNMPDGTVWIVATGSSQQLNDFVEWCKKGPPRAVVSNITLREESFKCFADFSIVR